MDFSKLTCDGCGKPFQQDDSIVTCPVCGTPQHRECYEFAGGCVNEAKHAEGFVYAPPKGTQEDDSSHEEERRRQKAVSENLNERINMTLRNGEMPDVDDVIQQRINAVCPGITGEQRQELVCGENIDLTAAFIGNNPEPYIRKFRRIEHNNARTFNWAAFFLSPYWFFWRKLYKAGIFVAAFDICVTLLSSFFVSPVYATATKLMTEGQSALTQTELESVSAAGMKIMALYALSFVIHLVLGFLGDRMYHKYCAANLKEFREIRANGMNEESLQFYLSKSSTSVIAVLVSLIVTQFLPTLIANWIF